MKLSVLGEDAKFSVFGKIDFCPALAALVSPVTNIISLTHTFSLNLNLRPNSWT